MECPEWLRIVGSDVNPSTRKQDIIHLVIVLMFAIGIGIYLIFTTALIAKDGVSYINYAKGLSVSPLRIMRDSSDYAPRLYTPGYPFLILMVHRLVDLFVDGSTELSWIYSAQVATLFCRVLALIPLYYIGKEIVGGRLSFLSMLVLVVLPHTARFGSDAIRAWPHLLFLATGFLFLIWGARDEKWWMFGVVGLTTGIGYTIRPMCAQLILYGILWLIYGLFKNRYKHKADRAKLIGGFVFLLIGFAVVAVPYMKMRGEILPIRFKQVIESVSLNSEEKDPRQTDILVPAKVAYTAGLSIRSDNVTKAMLALVSGISENLMYYFTPALFIGMYYYFRRNPINEAKFFITVFCLTNISIIILRYCIHPDMSRRYILPLVAFTVFFVPVGLQVLGRKTDSFLCKTVCKNDVSEAGSRQWFFISLLIGLVICLPTLVRPSRLEKKSYRAAAKWLKENTEKDDVIIVPDPRITFYAERKGFGSETGNIPASGLYIVKATVFRPHEKSDPDKTLQSSVGGMEDGNEGDTFLLEKDKCSSLKNLVGYWTADNHTLDSSIYGNHATAHGGAGYAAGRYGQAFNLVAGMDSYIDCGDNVSLNFIHSITLSAWIYPVANSRGSVITKNGPYFLEFCADRRMSGGVYAGSSPSWAVAFGKTALSLHTWHHVVMTYDGSSIKIYVDGELDGRPTVKSGDMPISGMPAYIGYGSPGLNRYFEGLIDEVMLFNTGLELEQIKSLSKMLESKTVPTFGSNVNAYPMFGCWKKIERKYSQWIDERKKEKLCVYKIE